MDYLIFSVIFGICAGILGGMFAWHMKFPGHSDKEILEMMLRSIWK